MKKSRGFTIIELIVVIAIIAILASIVFSLVVVYIGRAKDTAVKADVAQISKKLQIYYTGGGTYAGFVSPSVTMPCSHDYTIKINPDDRSYVVYAQLCTDSAKYWCIDSTNIATQLDNPPNSDVYSCVSGSGVISGCVPACDTGYSCVDSTCVSDGACSGTCSGCSGLGSNDYYVTGNSNSYDCTVNGNNCCSGTYGGCSWQGGNSNEGGYCGGDEGACSGDASSCGGWCPSGCAFE